MRRDGIRPQDLLEIMVDEDTPHAEDLHVSVMLDRCVELLSAVAAPDGATIVDATCGMGGHTEALLDRNPTLRVIAIDRDPEALKLAGTRLARFGDRATLVHAIYDELPQVLAERGVETIDGILFDLGVSSLQLDEQSRGFSYVADAPLDMRMDQSATLTAAMVVNTYDGAHLARIFREYGDEPFAGRIAREIVKVRTSAPLESTGDLVEITDRSIPRAAQKSRGHSAKRVFQAIRIEVNQELASLERALPEATDALRPGGRIVVMSFQSLEDRIVKRFLARLSTSSTPAGLPVELEGHGPEFRLLTHGAEQADAEEQRVNSRSKSVRLRAAEKLGEKA